jgi:hypothetical protein
MFLHGSIIYARTETCTVRGQKCGRILIVSSL